MSDFKDALSLQCLASILFLYCACMSPVITFGGLLGEATEGRIVSTKNGSGQAFRPSEASHCVHLSHLFILVFEEFTHST